MIVLILPRAQLAEELPADPESHAQAELLLVHAMTALDVPIGFRGYIGGHGGRSV